MADPVQWVATIMESSRTKTAHLANFNNDPFANDGKPIDISDDDLPF